MSSINDLNRIAVALEKLVILEDIKLKALFEDKFSSSESALRCEALSKAINEHNKHVREINERN